MGPYEEVVTADRVRAFSGAVANPGDRGVPPTFLTVFRQLEFALFDRMGVPLSKVLHAEQEYSYNRPIEVGMKVRYQTRVANILEKRGSVGMLAFMVLETSFEDAEGPQGQTPLAFSKTTIVVKDPFQ